MILVACGVGALLLGAWYLSANGEQVGTAAVNAVGNVTAGAVEGVGDWFGIPRTEQSACDKALAEGRTWDASFACPASDFLKGTWNNLWN